MGTKISHFLFGPGRLGADLRWIEAVPNLGPFLY